MAVSNGQLANQTSFNNAFLSRTQNSTTVAIVGFSNANAASGSAVTNIQREQNAIWSFIGGLLNQVKDYLPTWVDPNVGNADDTIIEKITAIDAEFNQDTGSLATRAGVATITNGAQEVTVAFGAAWADADYSPVVTVENTVDSDPIFLNWIITAKTVDGFTVKFNAPVDSANYKLNYRVGQAG